MTLHRTQPNSRIWFCIRRETETCETRRFSGLLKHFVTSKLQGIDNDTFRLTETFGSLSKELDERALIDPAVGNEMGVHDARRTTIVLSFTRSSLSSRA